MLGVQHFVRNLLLVEQMREMLRGLNRGRADQHRLAAAMTILDVGDDGGMFFLCRAIYLIRQIGADHRVVRWDHHHLETVDLLKFERLRIGRAGHAGQLPVQPEIILECDRRQRLVFVLDRHPFLGFDRLMQTVGPTPALHHAAGELVDDDDFVIAHDVVHLALEQRMRTQRGVEVVQQHDVADVVQIAALREQADLGQQLLDRFMAGLGQERLARLLVDAVIARTVLGFLPHQPRDDGVDLGVQVGALLRRTGDDQRRACLVDQDRIHLVDDGEVQAALRALLGAERHVVAQVVETVFVVGAIGDVGAVGRALLGGLLVRDHRTHRQTQEVVDLAHPLGVAPGEIVIHRDHVHTLAGQRIQVGRERRHQRLAFAGAHLGDLALMQHHATDELDIEVAHAERALRGLAHHGERLVQQAVERLAALEARAEFHGFGAQLLVGKRGDLGFERIDLRHVLLQTLEQAAVTAAEYFCEGSGQHESKNTTSGGSREIKEGGLWRKNRGT